MKKLIVLSLAGLLILALGATAYAQKLEFRASGFIDTQTFIGENVPQYPGGGGIYQVVNTNFSIDPVLNLQTFGVGPYGDKIGGFLTTGIPPAGLNKTASNWEGRAHLKFDAVMGPSLSGTIYFEIDTFRWGDSFGFGGVGNGSGNYYTSGNGLQANMFGGWNTDRTAVEVKNIYIDVGLPYFGVPWPVTVRVGAQPIGVRPLMLLYSDGTGITAGIKAGPVLINPIYAKAVSSPDFTHQDSDVYGLQVNAKVSTMTIGGYGLYYRMGSYPFFVVSSSVASGAQEGLLQLTPAVQGTQKSNMWWLGAYAGGKVGPVDLDFDFVYDFGKVMSELTPVPHVNYQGWASRLNVEYPWEKFKFGLTGMYASGADARHTDPTGTPGGFTNLGTFSRTNRGFVVPPGSEQGAFNGESIVMYSMEAGATGGYGIADSGNYTSMGRGGFGGTWFLKAYAAAKLAPWYKLTAQALYIGDTTTHGDTFGSAVKFYPNIWGQRNEDNQTIGVELDIFQDIQIYKNLRFWMGYGYLFAGSALKINRASGFNVFTPGLPSNFSVLPNLNKTPENPWAFRTRLIYTF